MSKESVKDFFTKIKEGITQAWDSAPVLLVLGMLFLGYLMWMPFFFALLSVVAVMFLGVGMHAKGAIFGMDVMRSIQDGTYDEPQPPAAQQPVDKEWNEDQL